MIKYLKFAVMLTVVGCSTDNPSSGTPPEDGQPLPEEEELVVSLENAFPKLGFNKPLDFQVPADGTNRTFVVEQGGVIKVVKDGSTASQSGIYLDISSKTNTSAGELGLLGLAFHPDYASNGLFYVYYTPTASESVLSRFSVSADPDEADPTSEDVLLRITQPYTNHNGGQLAFGPDGYLYIAVGDGGSGGDPKGNAQNLNILLGKILRIDVDQPGDGQAYGIPPDNPFVGLADTMPEIYAYGLRNPWRISFDVETGQLWAGDVGQGEIEEINIIESGGNYGWNRYEGTSCFEDANCDTDGLIPPLFEYNHSRGDKSITGGYVYRGEALPDLQGHYVYADYISGRLWALPAQASGTGNMLLLETGQGIASFGTDSSGELYICSFNGAVYRLVQG
jgi:glucose/arabinose dehydrogenase